MASTALETLAMRSCLGPVLRFSATHGDLQTCSEKWSGLEGFCASRFLLPQTCPGKCSNCVLLSATMRATTVLFRFSAGCGRTGVICAIDYTWMLLKDGVSPPQQACRICLLPCYFENLGIVWLLKIPISTIHLFKNI